MSVEWLAVARELALRAGEIHLKYWRTFDPADVKLKARRDPVTVADVEAERLIVGELSRRFPDHRVIAEEEGGHAASGAYEWIVDPLDGTVNFAHGLPIFCVSIALRRGADLLAGVVHAAALRETYEAELGAGARRNNLPLHVSRNSQLGEALLATGFAYRRNEFVENNVRPFTDLILRCRDIRRTGSAALDLAAVAAGHLDAYWEPYLHSWDIAAGALLVTESGGRVTDMIGGQEMLQRGDVLASNGTGLHEVLLPVVRFKAPA